jgi:uncharacterized protein YabN with tetrapyrrole methylase and pyrophosphatase domain
MLEFDSLLEVAERLNAPGGCPWDREQTFFSLQPYVLEEAHEVLEAVDAQDDQKVLEELGDLFYVVVFYSKVAEREGRFTIREIIEAVREKLIRRHPHVFGETKVEKVEEVMRAWEQIKRTEKAHEARQSALDGMPPTMPLLARSQKVVRRAKRVHSPIVPEMSEAPHSEQALGEEFLALVLRAENAGIDAESALRRALGRFETAFRSWEQESAR